VARTFATTLALFAVACGAVGCGGDDGKTPSQTAQTTETAPAPDIKDTSVKPVVVVSAGSPPRRLTTDDIVRGRGRPVNKGDSVALQYVGIAFSTGVEFDSSWDTGQPYPFRVGAGDVIAGWDRGVVGMRKGGRRQLVIPPELAYGSTGFGPIGPNETLVFVVDLVSVG